MIPLDVDNGTTRAVYDCTYDFGFPSIQQDSLYFIVEDVFLAHFS